MMAIFIKTIYLYIVPKPYLLTKISNPKAKILRPLSDEAHKHVSSVLLSIKTNRSFAKETYDIFKKEDDDFQKLYKKLNDNL